MTTRVILRPADGEPQTRDVVDGHWAEAEGPAPEVVGEGTWALPGLVDGHAHLAGAPGRNWVTDHEGVGERLEASLRAGVLRLYDKGWSDLTIPRLVRSVPPERRPHLEAAGVILAAPGGYIPGFAREIPPGELRSHVAGAVGEGEGWVKLIGDWPRKGVGPVPNFDENELSAAVAAASALGARVAVHTMAREVPAMAVRAGVHSIEHGLFLDESDVAALGGRGGTWVPTILQVQAVIRQLGPSSSGGRLLAAGLDNMRRVLPLAVEAGVRVLTGSDLATPSDRIHEEALALLEMGLSARAVLAAVSGASGAERFAPGAPADAVLLPANPLQEPGVIAHPVAVFRMGRRVR